jgi:PEGA domain-containing protein
MKVRPILAVAVILVLAAPIVVAAKGGAHASGHGGGGHASGSHGSSGHRSGGHSSGGHGSARHAPSPSSSAATSTSTGGHRSSNGLPIAGTAVPRTPTPVTSPNTTPGLLPARILPYGIGGAGLFYDPFFASGAGAWYSGAPSYGTYTGGTDGSLRLRVEPDNAEVFVDGNYVGLVNEFDGLFHHLKLPVGPHQIEIRQPAYEPLVINVVILTHHTTTYRGALVRTEP